MDRHLIVLDLDGTLLTDNKTISKRSLHTLREARKAGHAVAIATGRPFRASQMYYQELALDTPIVNFNGAFVHHPADYSFKGRHSPLDLNVAQTIIDTCQAFNVQNIMAEVVDDVYVHDYDEQFVDLFSMGTSPAAYGNLKHILDKDPTSLLVYPKEKEDAEHLQSLLGNKHAKGVHQRSWGAPFHMLEIIKTGNNKAAGLELVTEYCNVSMENVIAFGDEDNDLEMIEEAGIGVAMGNAISDLKNIANEVTLTNEEDGIALFLEDRLSLPSPSKR
ncbi:Cof-type HAD-IIB family hydrolase [Thalassobacillus sp. C254]|uniref:Cof-type HAD-IIB family hydrolase n=1 Tax=Thalassobacillus sp. C254 TaxID=1225341 RepID=UPI0006D2B1E3|nr:Cof-type HAD-IIB family hydrolase [Thalassobacillus sp. C254]